MRYPLSFFQRAVPRVLGGGSCVGVAPVLCAGSPLGFVLVEASSWLCCSGALFLRDGTKSFSNHDRVHLRLFDDDVGGLFIESVAERLSPEQVVGQVSETRIIMQVKWIAKGGRRGGIYGNR